MGSLDLCSGIRWKQYGAARVYFFQSMHSHNEWPAIELQLAHSPVLSQFQAANGRIFSFFVRLCCFLEESDDIMTLPWKVPFVLVALRFRSCPSARYVSLWPKFLLVFVTLVHFDRTAKV